MKISRHNSRVAQAGNRAAFTMIEIAIALGVIGFALVAIIGILPVGLNVQKEAHQDTIISQDAPFFLEAIRNGGPVKTNGLSTTSLDFLTNYVEQIAIVAATNGGRSTNYYLPSAKNLTNGQEILGLLCTPEYFYDPTTQLAYQTNLVVARVRGLSGSAMEQDGANSVVAFRYYMQVEVDHDLYVSADSTNYLAYPTNSFDYNTRQLRFLESFALRNNLYSVHLKFSFPVPSVGLGVGPGRQNYDCLISGQLQSVNGVYWFFQPASYTTNINLSL